MSLAQSRGVPNHASAAVWDDISALRDGRVSVIEQLPSKAALGPSRHCEVGRFGATADSRRKAVGCASPDEVCRDLKERRDEPLPDAGALWPLGDGVRRLTAAIATFPTD